MAYKSKKSKLEPEKKNSEILTEFRDLIALETSHGDVQHLDRDRDELIADPATWLTTNLLTFPEFCEHPDHMNFPPLSDKQRQAGEYMFGLDPKRTFDVKRTIAVLVWGKGGGKDQISVLMQLYIVYLLLNIQYPQRFLGIPDNSSIDMYNIACAKGQAETVYFQMLRNAVLNWRWLKNNWAIVANGRLFTSVDKDMDFLNKVTITGDAIVFPHNIRAFSGSSESESLEGKSPIVYVLDECDAFKEESINRNAKKIFATLSSSANSRFKGKQKGFLISWPRSKDGFIMEMYKKTRSFLNVYSDISPTWEAKPRHLYDRQEFEFEGMKIPMDFYEDFRLNPLQSVACYCCKPPDAINPFIDEIDKIDAAFVNLPHLYDFREITTPPDKDNISYVKKSIIRAPFMYDRTIKHAMAFDLSESRDYTALSIAHRDGDGIVFDLVTCWIPNLKTETKVDLINVEEIINNVRQDVTVAQISGDPWNSGLIIQKLRSKGVNARILKLDLEDYEMFRRLLYAGQIKIPKNEVLYKELKNLQLFGGKKVDHMRGQHNDLSVSVVMAVKMLLHLDDKTQASGLMAEGEYVGDNLYESVDGFDSKMDTVRDGVQVDGIQIFGSGK